MRVKIEERKKKGVSLRHGIEENTNLFRQKLDELTLELQSVEQCSLKVKEWLTQTAPSVQEVRHQV